MKMLSLELEDILDNNMNKADKVNVSTTFPVRGLQAFSILYIHTQNNINDPIRSSSLSRSPRNTADVDSPTTHPP
jgi:hypothetical protein